MSEASPLSEELESSSKRLSIKFLRGTKEMLYIEIEYIIEKKIIQAMLLRGMISSRSPNNQRPLGWKKVLNTVAS